MHYLDTRDLLSPFCRAYCCISMHFFFVFFLFIIKKKKVVVTDDPKYDASKETILLYSSYSWYRKFYRGACTECRARYFRAYKQSDEKQVFPQTEKGRIRDRLFRPWPRLRSLARVCVRDEKRRAFYFYTRNVRAWPSRATTFINFN